MFLILERQIIKRFCWVNCIFLHHFNRLHIIQCPLGRWLNVFFQKSTLIIVVHLLSENNIFWVAAFLRKLSCLSGPMLRSIHILGLKASVSAVDGEAVNSSKYLNRWKYSSYQKTSIFHTLQLNRLKILEFQI